MGLEELIGFVLEVAAEWLLQFVLEYVFGLLFRSVAAPFSRRERSAVLRCVGHLLLGAVAGAVSLRLCPRLLITAPWLRVVNLVVTPLLVGLAMAALGRRRRRRGLAVGGLDGFVHGGLFALALAVVRFVWGS